MCRASCRIILIWLNILFVYSHIIDIRRNFGASLWPFVRRIKVITTTCTQIKVNPYKNMDWWIAIYSCTIFMPHGKKKVMHHKVRYILHCYAIKYKLSLYIITMISQGIKPGSVSVVVFLVFSPFTHYSFVVG